MKLQRTTMMAAYPHVGTKDFYAADDVDALLASIRAAVAEERGAEDGPGHNGSFKLAYIRNCRAALDALLSGEG